MEEFFEEEKQWNIMQLQKKSLLCILKLNASKAQANGHSVSFDKQLIWKVLIYDSYAKEVISPLIKIDKVHNYNITLFLDLESKREKIHNVAAIYLIKPCKESIGCVVRDLNNKLYDRIFVNFLSPCSDKLLEYFANECRRSNSQNTIAQVFSHYLNYSTITSRLFTLNIPDAYASFYRCHQLSENVDSYIDAVAEGLFMFLKTNTLYPFIRFHKHDIVAQKVATGLRKLYERAMREEDKIPELTLSKRPLLLLLNRSIDVHTMLHHPWKYISLVHDVFGIRGGRVEVEKKVYEFDWLTDTFLQEHELSDYPEVARTISTEVDRFMEKQNAIINKDDGNISAKLNEVMAQLPEITERKNQLEAHTNLSHLLYDHIKKRGFDQLNDTELQIMASKNVSSSVTHCSL
eukprot:TRINITY_DN7808_c0_g6_i3.p1 TRINITY_DN7808_c0_g6~~TRINITY_DN7808_c0_g6_i3.p1  ORF type:complete len:405 (+),score=139.15 TRINITY_DN7808_c0_g6_i3:191-1405(+)